MPFFKFLWEKWKQFALVFGVFMSAVILSILYVLLITPYALCVKLFSDPLRLKSGAGWVKKTMPKPEIAAAQQQH